MKKHKPNSFIFCYKIVFVKNKITDEAHSYQSRPQCAILSTYNIANNAFVGIIAFGATDSIYFL